ncbi:MAG: D-hexose-6-phosphate mutarotase [Kiritimatiellae bacterium]|nr:D-hexose-6-phosphate mutarotase [Kiritimatiellia bacterium]
MSSVDALNDEFAIAEHVTFMAGPGGLTVAAVSNAHATARVALHGAHVMAFQPHGQAPVLWMSKKCYYEVGKPIRGGIPVCWPWFSQHRTNPDMPAHGFVRLVDWDLAGTAANDDGSTALRLRLRDSEATRAMWPHAFEIELQVNVGSALRARLLVRNPGETEFTCTGALHTYFTVSDVAQIRILGLQGVRYRETIYSPDPRTQAEEAITFDKETDRVYMDTDADCIIEDPGLNRRIRNRKAGSRSTVVWNPWIEKAKRMADFDDNEYPGMVCVETANTEPNAMTVPAGGEHVMAATLTVE